MFPPAVLKTWTEDDDLTDEQFMRYARHLALPEVEEEGQQHILHAKVLVVGAGGLGCPSALYLAAAGVGQITLVDHDTVDLSNLQRQIAHGVADQGTLKVDSAKAAIAAINPEITVQTVPERLSLDNVMQLVSSHDLVLDCTDNFNTRFLLNDACVLAKKTLVSASILKFDGQLSVFKPHVSGPCYRCIFPSAPPPDMIPRCDQAGVLGATVGIMGTLQATEALKEIMGLGESQSGFLTLYDGLGGSFTRVQIPKNPQCACCGDAPTITDLSEHHG